MPELPEVETIRVGLSLLLPGKEILSVVSDWPKSLQAPESEKETFLLNSKIINVRRRAKVLIIDLSTDYSLVIHLKMTGQLVYINSLERFGAGHPTASLSGQLPDKSTRVIFKLNQGNLFFNDQRKFGWIKLIPTSEVFNLKFFQKVGPEPLSKNFTNDIFLERVKKRANSTIKATLLDQTVLAGVGNIYADEALWGAKIHPASRVKDIQEAKLKTLLEEIKYVFNLSIEKGGSTDKNYVDAKGKRGSYLEFARVFRKEGQFCPRHHEIIQKIRVAGRGTHICPKCQQM